MFESWFPKEWSTIKKIIWLKAAQGIGSLVTLTGSIVSFIASKAKAINALTVTLEPIQEGSGDPSPDNVRPITGWTGAKATRTGKNLYSRENSQYNVPVYAQDGTTASYADVAVWWFKAKPNTTYSVSCLTPTKAFYFRWINCKEDKSFISRPVASYANSQFPLNITTPANTGWVQIAVNQYQTSQISSNDWEICIAEGSNVPYEAYTGTTLTASFPDTVYGCTVDLVSGVLTVTKGILSITTASLFGDYDSSTGKGTFWYTAGNPSISKDNDGIICNRMKNVSNISVHSSDGELSYYASGIIRWTEQRAMSQADYRTWLANNPIQVAYNLKEPITIQLTEQQIITLVGQNNIWGDGTVSVTIPSNIIVT